MDEQWWTWITSLNALPHLSLTYVAPSCWNCLLEMLLTQGRVFFDFWPRQFISTQLLWRPFSSRLEWRKSKSIQALMEKIYTLRIQMMPESLGNLSISSQECIYKYLQIGHQRVHCSQPKLWIRSQMLKMCLSRYVLKRWKGGNRSLREVEDEQKKA